MYNLNKDFLLTCEHRRSKFISVVCLIYFWREMRKAVHLKVCETWHSRPYKILFNFNTVSLFVEIGIIFLIIRIFFTYQSFTWNDLDFFKTTWFPLFLALQCVWTRLNNIPRSKSIRFHCPFIFKILSRKVTLLFPIVTLPFRGADKVKFTRLLASGLVLLKLYFSVWFQLIFLVRWHKLKRPGKYSLKNDTRLSSRCLSTKFVAKTSSFI